MYIAYYALFLAGLFLFCRSKRTRQQRILDGIGSRDIMRMWWLHRGKLHILELNDTTKAKRPKEPKDKFRCIILQCFTMDGSKKNTDTFLISKLYVGHPPNL